MSIKVANHIYEFREVDDYRNPIEHVLKHPDPNPRTYGLYEVYTSKEINSKIESVQNLIAKEVLELTNSLKATNTKIDNSLQKINEAIGDIPKMIMNDEVFRSSIKKEIIEEIRRELGSNP